MYKSYIGYEKHILLTSVLLLLHFPRGGQLMNDTLFDLKLTSSNNQLQP